MLSSDVAAVIVDYIEELLRSRQFEVVVVIICGGSPYGHK